MATQMERGVPLSALCPKFLHSNSTSHTWPFSAIAELIDNAYDPDVSAKQLWIDKTQIKGQECLSFMDNGNGLNYEKMLKMLSFGYSDKTALNGLQPIGIYGNGFKSGSMRLGQDAIVFSKSKDASCIGMLSQSYLKEIDAEQIIIPIVSCEREEPNKFCVKEQHKASLQDILRYSPFNTEAELLTELNAINATGANGTRIIIWNLRRTSAGTTEFDFVKDRYDIQIPFDIYEAINEKGNHHEKFTSSIPESETSLRAYCSILYLKPRMQIMIRGQKVKTQLISKCLAHIAKDHYKPNFLNKRIPITFGYNTKSKEQYGIMMYYKNRLIKAYKRVGCQLKANIKGLGVIGVIECNFLDPTHNKQNFNNTDDKYRKTIYNLGIKLEEYWNEVRYKRNREDPNSTTLVEDAMKRPDQNWVQCDDCLCWRKLPDGIDCNLLPDKWFCGLNPDPQFRSCQVEEEPEDSDDDQPSYQKTYKQHEREDKKKQEREKQMLEGEQKRRDEERINNLALQNKNLRQQHQDLKRQLNKKTVRAPVHSPSTLDTPRKRVNIETAQGGAARAESPALRSSSHSSHSQAACNPSSSSSLPIILNVCSLSKVPTRMKRTSPLTPESVSKRPRINGFHRNNSEAASSVKNSPERSMSTPIIPVDGDDDNITDDDDIVILETVSTPVPKKPDLAKVKVERQPSDPSVGMLMECSDDVAMDKASETNTAGTSSTETAAVGTGPSPPPPPEQTSSATQTEVPTVKEEEKEEEEKIKQRKDEIKEEGEERTVQSMPLVNGNEQSLDVDTNVCNVEQRVIKLDSTGDSVHQGMQTLHNGETSCQLDANEAAGPSHADPQDMNGSTFDYPSMSEVQKQQDQLLELMHAAAQERDSYKEQVHILTRQLHDMETRLQELSQATVKRECAHQASQTKEAQGEQDYKSLYEQAKEKVDVLSREREALLAVSQANPNTAQSVEKVSDEIALQIDSLIQAQDQSNKEKDELHSQGKCLEEEQAKLLSQCEELKLNLQQQRTHTEESSTTQCKASHSRVETETGGTLDSDTASNSEAFRSLMELRQNVGRLLVSFVPALDLDQVNYKCNVIDEILDQVVCEVETIGITGRGTEQEINERVA